MLGTKGSSSTGALALLSSTGTPCPAATESAGGGMPQWHTSGMRNPPPRSPQANDTWIDDDGELHVWDGTKWAPYEDDAPGLPAILDYIYREE